MTDTPDKKSTPADGHEHKGCGCNNKYSVSNPEKAEGSCCQSKGEKSESCCSDKKDSSCCSDKNECCVFKKIGNFFKKLFGYKKDGCCNPDSHRGYGCASEKNESCCRSHNDKKEKSGECCKNEKHEDKK